MFGPRVRRRTIRAITCGSVTISGKPCARRDRRARRPASCSEKEDSPLRSSAAWPLRRFIACHSTGGSSIRPLAQILALTSLRHGLHLVRATATSLPCMPQKCRKMHRKEHQPIRIHRSREKGLSRASHLIVRRSSCEDPFSSDHGHVLKVRIAPATHSRSRRRSGTAGQILTLICV